MSKREMLVTTFPSASTVELIIWNPPLEDTLRGAPPPECSMALSIASSMDIGSSAAVHTGPLIGVGIGLPAKASTRPCAPSTPTSLKVLASAAFSNTDASAAAADRSATAPASIAAPTISAGKAASPNGSMFWTGFCPAYASGFSPPLSPELARHQKRVAEFYLVDVEAGAEMPPPPQAEHAHRGGTKIQLLEIHAHAPDAR